MNETINKFSFSEDKFTSEIHFRKPATQAGKAGFMYCACEPITNKRKNTKA